MLSCPGVESKAELVYGTWHANDKRQGACLLRPLIRGGGGQGRAQTIVTVAAAATKTQSPNLDEVLHLKTSEMLACITVTKTRLPRAPKTQILLQILSYLSCWSHHPSQEMEECFSLDFNLESTAPQPRGRRNFPFALLNVLFNVTCQSHDQLLIPQICHAPPLCSRHCFRLQGYSMSKSKILALMKIRENRQ